MTLQEFTDLLEAINEKDSKQGLAHMAEFAQYVLVRVLGVERSLLTKSVFLAKFNSYWTQRKNLYQYFLENRNPSEEELSTLFKSYADARDVFGNVVLTADAFQSLLEETYGSGVLQKFGVPRTNKRNADKNSFQSKPLDIKRKTGVLNAFESGRQIMRVTEDNDVDDDDDVVVGSFA
eukprot:gnl/MRDRNA2_/MRDRNA2_107683_c0_seq1.p1 gnl/MRDRNA2_/MRDRNA2_107683_c0~~gnl/MRDRNA2_/MRDRNA2_107683_c0_seq1.p1  ORF type:complete len:192 (+),score=41.10 gnl/MRDRNA2_/MRDRNA2_107683_c0_seq1:44-577(+)